MSTECTSCASMGYTCGAYTNNCSTTLDCGTCSSGYDCVSNHCATAACTPLSECLPSCCRAFPDGCGGRLDCGGCSASDVCNNCTNC